MKLNDFENAPVTEALPLGTHTVIFEKLEYRTDKLGDVVGAFIHIRDFDNLYVPIFDDERNFQYNYLRRQLGVKSRRASDFNAKQGTPIICTRYISEDGKYTNTSFNPNPRDNYGVEEFA